MHTASWVPLLFIVKIIKKAIEDLTMDELKELSSFIDDDIYDYIEYQNILNKGIKVGLLL